MVRRTEQGQELVLGKRRRERDGVTWSLPKGTPDGSETIEETALREVVRGDRPRSAHPGAARPHSILLRPVVDARIHKTVHYFLMAPTGGDLSQHDHEFDEVRWVGAAEAEAIMSFPTEREIMLRALALPEAA